MNDFLQWVGTAVVLAGKILLACLLAEAIVIAVGIIVATVKAMADNMQKKKTGKEEKSGE